MITDPKFLAKEIRRLEDNSLRFSPQRNWQFVTLTFPSTPNTDIDVPHSLNISDVEGVQYAVVQQSAPGFVYHDRSAGRVPWQQGFIRLRSTTASMSVTLLLTAVDNPSLVNPSPNADQFEFPGDIVATGGLYERDRLTAAGEWLQYTPTVKFGANAFTLGNGTLFGKYTEIGTTTFFRVVIFIGSTTAFPTSGAMKITLPTTASAGGLQGHFGPAILVDSSTGSVYPNNLTALVTTTEVVVYQAGSPSVGTVTDTSPFALANGDSITLTGFYENG